MGLDRRQTTEGPAGSLAGSDTSDLNPSTEAVFTDTVVGLQMEIEELCSDSMCNQTGDTQTSSQRSRQTTFMSTKESKFARVTSWEQYCLVFDAIVQSNRWDDAMATLQLLSHVEGDALNVALLVPETQRASRDDLVWALTAHYRSPGRLADYRQQFEKTIRRPEEDPSIFAVALETLAVKDFTTQLCCVSQVEKWVMGPPDVTFPSLLPGWKAEKAGSGYVLISPRVVAERLRAENGD